MKKVFSIVAEIIANFLIFLSCVCIPIACDHIYRPGIIVDLFSSFFIIIIVLAVSMGKLCILKRMQINTDTREFTRLFYVLFSLIFSITTVLYLINDTPNPNIEKLLSLITLILLINTFLFDELETKFSREED